MIPAVLFLMLFGTAQPRAAAPQDFSRLSQQADAARQQNRLTDAIALYRRALAVKPGWPEGWWSLGTILYDQDRYAEARDAFRRLLALKPNVGPPLALLGLCEFETRQYEPALVHLDQADHAGIGDNPQMQRVVEYHRAILLSRFERFENAMPILVRMAKDGHVTDSIVEAAGITGLRKPVLPSELPPTERELVMAAGQAVLAAGERNAAEAKNLFQALVARYPRQPNVHYLYGTFLMLSDADAGLQEMKKELEISPAHLPALVSIAMEYVNRGDAAGGKPYAEKAARLAPGSFAARAALGRVLVDSGDLAAGIRELEASVKLAPDSPQTRYALANAYAKAGRKEDAAREREAFVKLRRELSEKQ